MNVYMLLASRPSQLDPYRHVVMLVGIYSGKDTLKAETRIQAAGNSFDELRVETLGVDELYLGETLHYTGYRVWSRQDGHLSEDEWTALLSDE